MYFFLSPKVYGNLYLKINRSFYIDTYQNGLKSLAINEPIV